MSVCNQNRANCTPEEVLAATAIPACGQLVNPSNLQAEQLVFDQAFNELINNFGIPVDYYINTFNLSAADLLYGEDFGSSDVSSGPAQFKGPLSGVQMYIELNDDAVNLSKFGFDPGDEFTAYVHISTFYDAASAYFNYASVGQSIEPKAGDVIDLTVLGCDRPNGRGSVKYQITERMDQDVSSLNPILGHYVYRLRGKRYAYSFESGLSSEKANEQVYDNSFSGILSTTLVDQLTSQGKTYPTEEDPYDIDTVSKSDVMDMDVNNTDIYGSYY